MREGVEAVYDVNDWISADPDWIALINKARGSNVSTPSNPLNVFYPAQQDPQGGFPYVRYVTSTGANANNWWMQRDEIMYAMYFGSIEHSAAAMNIIFDKIKTGDASAQALNRWVEDSPYGKYYEYHNFDWQTGGSIEPSGEQGGAHARLVSFSLDYSRLTGLHIA